MHLPDEHATMLLGARIARVLAAGDAVLLFGDLGAGKTALARAILRARGVTGAIPSPTFTLVQSYDTEGLTVHHFDLYRIKDPRELDEIGLDDALNGGAALIEWPERAEGRLPGNALSISLVHAGGDAREATFTGPARWRDFMDTKI